MRLGSTGATFDAVVLILRARRPRPFALESVDAMLGTGEAFEVIRACEAEGYIAIVKQSNCRQFGIPQTRPRIWFLGYRCDLIEASAWPLQAARDRLAEIWEQYQQGQHQLMDLNGFLWDHDHPCVRSTRESALQRLADGSLDPSCGKSRKPMAGDKMLARKRQQDCEHGVHSYRDSSLDRVFPTYLLLPERQKAEMDDQKVRFPHPEPLVFNLSLP